MSFNAEEVRKHIKESRDDVGAKKIEVKDFHSDSSFDTLGLGDAYRIDGVHGYVNVINMEEVVGPAGKQTEARHRRLLRFLDIYMTAAHHLMAATGVRKIDFQNERLHFLAHRPASSSTEKGRVATAVHFSWLLAQLLGQANKSHPELANIHVSVGIDTGVALAVRNGTRADREGLFLGNSANLAAKAAGANSGLYLGVKARAALGGQFASIANGAALTDEQIADCIGWSDISTKVATARKQWTEALEGYKTSEVRLHQRQLPLGSLVLDTQSVLNATHMPLVFLRADVDGFTHYIQTAIEENRLKDAIVALHVIRKSLRDVVRLMGGQKVRYEGDCIHAVLASGDGLNVDAAESVTDSIALAAALHDTFRIVREELPSQTKGLGLQVGLEFGTVSLASLGVKGSRSRCAVGDAVTTASEAQHEAKSGETGLGKEALSVLAPALSRLFIDGIAAGLTYNKVIGQLELRNDTAVKRLDVPRVAQAARPQPAYLPK